MINIMCCITVLNVLFRKDIILLSSNSGSYYSFGKFKHKRGLGSYKCATYDNYCVKVNILKMQCLMSDKTIFQIKSDIKSQVQSLAQE